MNKRIGKTQKAFFLLSLLFCLAALIVQPAVAQPVSFFGDSFNITPDASSSNQIASEVAYNRNQNQWLVVWEDNWTGNTEGIYAQRVDQEGNLVGGLIAISDTANELHRPTVAFDYTQSRYLVVWENDSNFDIEGRVINANGTFYTGVITIQTGTHACSDPDVAYNPITDEYLVVYDYDAFAGNHDIRGIRVGVDGIPDPGGEFPITNTGYVEATPALAANAGDGNYLVVFSRHHTPTYNIGGQRLLGDGTLSGGVLSIISDAGDELSPDVVFNPADDWAFVSWHHDVAVGTTEVKGRIVRADNSMGGVPTISAVGGNDNTYPSIAYAPASDPYLVVWQDNFDVFGRWITVNGAIASEIIPITGADTQYAPAVAFGVDRYLATFNNWDGQYDIYGRFGTANGRLWLPIVVR